MNKKILKASAGTGKTYRLSIEFIASLLMGENFENILVMTFTKKATAEIRERILEQLSLIINDNEEGQEILDNIIKIYPDIKIDKVNLGKVYTEIIKNKEKIKIYTIDSFTNLLFKKAIAPHLNIYNYEIISDEKNSEYIQQLFEKIINNKKLFTEIKSFFSDNAEKDIDTYFDLIKSILSSRWKFLLIDEKERKKKGNTEFFIPLEEGINTLKEIAKLKEKEDEFESFLSKDFKKYYYMDISAKKQFIEDNYKDFFNSKSLKFWNGVKTRGKNVAGLKEKMEDYFLEFKENLAAYVYNHFIIPFEQHIFNFANILFELYDNIKFFEKKFTHNDISTYTYKYFYEKSLNLVNDNNVTEYFYQLIGGDISTVFIDEFQDTSILQWKILKPIIENSESVICVGDSKQSIYGWRGGEKKLFDKLENIVSNSSVETLDTSYRSQKNVIEFINSFFHKTSDIFDYIPVNFVKEKNGGYVYTYIENKDDEISSVDKMIEILKNEITNYSGVGIVARTKKHLNQIAEKLNEENIPFITNDGQSIVEHRACKGIYQFIKYLCYDDYFYLIEFLRSDIINIDETSLKELIINSIEIQNYLNYKEELANINNSSLKKILGFIKGFKAKKLSKYFIKTENNIRLDNLAKTLIQEFALTEKFTSNSDRKNIFKFYELLQNFTDLNNFINFVEENINEESLRQVAVEELNAVKLMTIHKSKGLEFETEFLYWELSSNSARDRGLKFYSELNADYSQVEDYLLTSASYSNILNYLNINFKTNEKLKEEVEELNNLYVAITRPKKNLFLFLNTKTKKDKINKKNDFFLSALKKSYDSEDIVDISEKSFGDFNETPLNNIEKEKVMDINIDFDEWFENTELNDEKQSEIFIKKHNKDYTMSIEKENKRKIGLAVHYYLSFIKYASTSERELATKMTLAKYGNMFGKDKMANIFETTDKFISKYSDDPVHGNIFNKKYKVFTEYEIFDTIDNKKYILDRITIDDENKVIHVYDYKTGDYNEEQLKTYERILKEQVDKSYKVNPKNDYYLSVE